MDQYDQRIEELRDAVFELGGYVAMLSPGNEEGRAYWHRLADEMDRERRALIVHAVRLRRLDSEIHAVESAITSHRSQRHERSLSWVRLAVPTGVLAGLLLLLGWWPVIASCLVITCALATWRSVAARRADDPALQEYADQLEWMEDRRAEILDGIQSPSASSPASAPEGSDPEYSATAVFPSALS